MKSNLKNLMFLALLSSASIYGEGELPQSSLQERIKSFKLQACSLFKKGEEKLRDLKSMITGNSGQSSSETPQVATQLKDEPNLVPRSFTITIDDLRLAQSRGDADLDLKLLLQKISAEDALVVNKYHEALVDKASVQVRGELFITLNRIIRDEEDLKLVLINMRWLQREFDDYRERKRYNDWNGYPARSAELFKKLERLKK